MAKVDFAYEPLGAAYWYARDLKTPQTMLVADFGAAAPATSSVMRFEPGGARAAGGDPALPCRCRRRRRHLRLSHHRARRLAARSARGTQLPLLREAPADSGALPRRLRAMAPAFADEEPRDHGRAQGADPRRCRARKLEDLLTVIEYDLGYELYRAVSAAKIALSGADETGSTSARWTW